MKGVSAGPRSMSMVGSHPGRVVLPVGGFGYADMRISGLVHSSEWGLVRFGAVSLARLI
jgi:hypothetical protein